MGRLKEFNVEEALDRALETFWEKGYEAASLQDLTDRMGIQRPSLYATYGSKAELFRAALEQYQARGYAALESRLAAGGAPLTLLRETLESVLAQEEGVRRGCFCVNVAIEVAPHDPEIRGILEAHFARVEKLLARTIAAGQADGSIRIDLTPLQAAAYFLTAWHGLQVAAKATESLEQLRPRIDLMLDALSR